MRPIWQAENRATATVRRDATATVRRDATAIIRPPCIGSPRLCEYEIRYADHLPTEKIMFRGANNSLGQ